MEYMETIDQILLAEYLFRARPETVYEWFKSLPKRSPDDYSITSDSDYEKIESKLLERKDEIVDLALAAWGRNANTTGVLYKRWCTPSVIPEWPPKPSTYPHAMLAALLANDNANILLPNRGYCGSPVEFKNELNWIFEDGEGDGGLFYLVHNNIALGLSLLQSCVEKKGPYARISDSRWLHAIATLAKNKALHRLKKSTSYDGFYSDTHDLLIKAAKVSPKTLIGASVIGRLFAEDFYSDETQDASGGEELGDAVNAWNVELPDADKHSWLEYSNEIDALAPAERVQFHLLRHYRFSLDLDPDDPVRVNRLAAYALNSVNGGQPWNLEPIIDNCKGKGLDNDSFQRYAEHDGAAFMYANSFNENIWSNDAIAEMLIGSLWHKANYEYPYPEKNTAIYLNREEAKKRANVKQAEESKEYYMKPNYFEQQMQTSIAKVSEELGETRQDFITYINALGNWVVTGGILVIVLLLLLFIFKH